MKTGQQLMLVTIAFFLACSQDRLTGTIGESDTGITGKISNENLSDAQNAQVKLFIAGDTSKTALDTMASNPHGGYTFTNLLPGTYNIWVDGADSSVAFVDSIIVPAHQEVLANATLGKPVSVWGIVALQPGHSPMSVTVQALGTQKFSNVDTAGHFFLKGVAAGGYTLRCVSTIYGYTPTYKEITVAGPGDDTLTDTIFMVFSGIPVVTGIVAVYDPYTGIAKISWNKMKYDFLYQYRIYRDAQDAIQPSSSAYKASVDTVLYDTLFTPFSQDTATRLSLRYRITIFNKSYQEGLPYNFADINAVNPVKLVSLSYPVQGQRLQSGSGIMLRWNSVTGVSQYHVYLSSDSGFTDTVFQAISGDTTALVSTLAAGIYYAKIRAKSPAGTWGEFSIPVHFYVNLFYSSFSQTGSYLTASDMIQTKDNGYLIAGASNNDDVLLLKIDSLGNEQWRHVYPENNSQQVTAVKSLPDGYIVFGTNDIALNVSAVFVLKVDLNGAMQWFSPVGDSSAESATSFDVLSTGTLLAGSSQRYKAKTDTADWQYHYVSKFYSVDATTGAAQPVALLDSSTSGPFIIQRDASSFIVFSVFAPSGAFQNPDQIDTISISAISNSYSVLWSYKTALSGQYGPFSIESVMRNALGEFFVKGSVHFLLDSRGSLLKFSENGTYLSICNLGSGVGGPSSLAQSPSGNLYALGLSAGIGTNSKFVVVNKVKETMELEWASTIASSVYAYNSPHALIQRPDSSLAVLATGSIESGMSEIYLFNITMDGKAIIP
jgi:hypothetical protein